MTVKLTKAQRIKVSCANDAYSVMQQILLRENKIEREKEHFWVIGLDQGGVISFVELISIGSYKGTIVEPINVFRVAVLKGAGRIVLVHNHPSGQLKPSEQDKRLTNRLIQVGKIIKVDVMDHLIITPTSFLSFFDIGLYQELKESLEFWAPYRIEKQIRREEKKLRKEAVNIAREKGFKKGKKEGIKEGLEKGRKAEKLKMAKSLKQQQVRETHIANASGLPMEEIEALKVEPFPTVPRMPIPD